MKIAQSQLQMVASHTSLQQRESRESLRVWIGDRPPANTAQPASGAPVLMVQAPPSAPPAPPTSELPAEAVASEAVDEATENDPKLMLMRMMIEMFTGEKIKVMRSTSLQGEAPPGLERAAEVSQGQAARAGFGIEYDAYHAYREMEQTTFSAAGVVKTADGREIRFELNLSMSRQYVEEQRVSVRIGDAARKIDPLVLNFSGKAAELTDERFAFDLNSDGQTEQIARLASGSGYLVFDRNENGKVDNGRELFGPQTGNGFQELAQFDDDGNGWIDENDRIFDQLKLWTPNADGGGELRSLKAADVGAISLAAIATPFSLKNNANQLLGDVRSSGIFLHESGAAGTIQQIDLSV